MAIRRINPNENINLDQNQVIEPNVAIQQPKTTIRKLAPNESIMLDQERVQVPAYAADRLYYPQKPEDNSLSGLLKFGATDAARRAYEYSGNITTQAADVADRVEYGARKFFYDLIGQPEPTPQIDTIQAPKQNWVSSKLTESADQDFANANILAGKVNEINAEPTVDWEQVKQDPVSMNTLRFMAEQGTISSPEMLMAMVPILGLPLIGSTTSQSIIEDRQRNLGKDPRSVTPEDFLFSSTIGLGSGGLERLGGLASAGLIGDAGRVTMSQIPRNALESGLEEAATEAIQNPLELVGSTVGTGQELTTEDLLDSAAQGALVGFGTGTVVRTGTDSVRALKNGITQQPMDNGGVIPDENALNPDIPLLPPPAPASPPVPNRDDLARMISAKPDATTENSSAVQPETVKPPISGIPEIGDTIEHIDGNGLVIEGSVDSIQEGENGQRTLIVTDAQGNQNIVFDGEGETIIRDKRPLNRDDLLSEIQRGQPKQDVAPQAETQPLIEPDIAPQDTPIAIQKQPKTDTIESVQSSIDNIRAQAKMSGWNGMLKRREQEALNQLSALKQTEINQAALNANPEPTEAQKESGNYKKGHIKIAGLDIAIENAKGSVRSGVDSDGEAWNSTMKSHYGYIKRTEGADGDAVDVYIGDNPEAQEVFFVDQIDPKTGKFDESKVMIGFNSSREAGDAYQAAFSDGSGVSRVGAVHGMTVAEFKDWLKNGDTKKPLIYQEPAPQPAKTQEVKQSSVMPKPNTSLPIKGEVGMMLSSGQIATTASGRTTTPFPKFSTETPRKTSLAVKNVENWLMQNALAEANARGDEFNALQFQANIKKPSQAGKDSAEYYLFGETQPQVQKSIFREPKPVVTSKSETTTEPVSAENVQTAPNVQNVQNVQIEQKTEDKPVLPVVPSEPEPKQENNSLLEEDYNGVRLYQIKVRNPNDDDKPSIMWAVESNDNKVRREKGERAGMGDSLHQTLDEAKKQADFDVLQREDTAKRDALNSAKKKEEEDKAAAIKSDTYNGFLDGKPENTKSLIRKALSKQYNFTDGSGVMTVRERIEKFNDNGTLKISTLEENKIKPMSKMQFHRADQKQQDAHEARVKEAGKKTTYLVNESELGKIGYDYAEHLLSQKSKQDQETAPTEKTSENQPSTPENVPETPVSGPRDQEKSTDIQKVDPATYTGLTAVVKLEYREKEGVPNWSFAPKSISYAIRGRDNFESNEQYYNSIAKDIGIDGGRYGRYSSVTEENGNEYSKDIDNNRRIIISIVNNPSRFKDGSRIVAESLQDVFNQDVITNPSQIKNTPKTTEPQESTATEKTKDTIEDFGEKIAGAKKDLWKDYAKSIGDELPDDLKDITLSKHFPEPNYEVMIANGVSTDVLAAIKAMRDIIPSKPQKSWKLKEWASKVKTVRELSKMMLDGKLSLAQIKEKMGEYSMSLSGLAQTMELYSALGYPAFTKAKGWSVRESRISKRIDGEIQDIGNRWMAASGEEFGKDFDTKEQAIDYICSKIAIDETTNGKKEVRFDVFRITKTGEIVIGKKIAAGKFINLKGGFKTGNEARLYMANNSDEILALYEKKKDVPPERRSTNDPRRGEDYRKGEDVSVEALAKTFGFRGIQFGNYVEQKRRAEDINNAYDAMKDMATILGVPDDALSLEGTLGLAFGARGGGNFAAAHYERGQTVINLTKKSGAGSLAHEWFHAMDHNFGKRRDGKDVYITESAYIPTKEIRKEVTDAFADIVKAIKKTGIVQRSESIDKTRTKDYWSTDIEMAARSFEAYIIYKAGQKDASNDYLANVVGEDAWNASRDESKDNSSYPYPTDKEMSETIAPAFDKLFDILETKDTDKGAVMFSISSKGTPKDEMQKISNYINKKEWWRAALPDDVSIKERGVFLASSYSEASFYGRPLDNTFKVNISKPLVGDENYIMKKLSIENKLDDISVNDRFLLDKLMKEKASDAGYDSIVLLTPNGYKKFIETGNIPKSIELNVFSKDKISNYDKTDTKEFKKWFGDSKIVDADGKPLVVYHGSPLSFDKFKEGSGIYGSGIYFSKDKKTAQSYSDNGVIYETYLSIQKPFIIDDLDSLESEYENDGEVDTTALIENLKSSGFDGIIINDKNSETYAVAFDPEQIKSVNNRGTFDENDPRIMYQMDKGTGRELNQEKVDKIVSALNTEAKKFGIPDNAIVMFKDIKDVKNVPGTEKASQDGGVVEGFYYRNLIYIALTAKDYISTLNHEVLHYLKAAGALQPEWDLLLESAAKWRKKYNIDENYADVYGGIESKLDEEAIAHALQDYSNKGILNRVRNKIVKYFNMVKNVLTGRGFNYKTPQDVFDDIMSGEIGRRRFDPEYDVEPMFSRGKTQDDIPATLDDLYAKINQNPEYKNTMVGLVEHKNGDILINAIEVERPNRGQGIGTKIMEDIISFADAKGKRVLLSPSTDFGATSVSRLNAFYKSFGFVHNRGKNKDFTTKETMIREPQAMFSRKVIADGLQSTLVKSVKNLKQEKGTGVQMLGILKNMDGVKEEEIAWTGLDDFLVSKRTVSKQEIVDYLDQNQVRIEEVTLGDNRKEQYAITNNGDFFEDGYSTREEAENRRDELEQELDKTLYVEATEGTDSLTGETVTGNTKFSKYTLPGGENYREVLLTLPARDESKARMVFIEEDESYTVYDTEGKIYSTDLTEQEAKDELLGLGVNIDQVKSNFNSSHYDQPNILAHVRLNDRTDADGKKVLFVEEIQSDWHQAGRKKGYKSNKMPTPEEAKEYYAIRNSDWENMSSEEKQSYVNEMNADPDYIRAHVPDAPFKKSWHEMTFRRVVQMAAQEGYDSVAWTTGEMQNDRYDLSKQIKQIITERDDTGITLKAYDVDNKKVINKSGLKESDLEDYVGKDVAKRIVEQLDEGKEASPKRQKSDIRGDDLKVIGGGMKGFYDNILVKYANKFGKKFDAKVSDTNLSGANRLDQESQSYYGPIVREGELADEIEQDTLPSVSVKNQAKDVLEAMENGTSFNDAIAKFGSESLANHFGGKLIFTKENIKVHSMDITPAMTEAAEEGLPLFSRIGGIGKKKMTKEEQLEQAIASLDARGLADKLRPAIGKIASYVLHPHQIASLYKSFTPVYLAAIEMMKMRDVLVHKLSKNVHSYNKINKKSKAKIDAVLEIGRLSKTNFKPNENGIIVVKNEGFKDTVWSKDGDEITLSDVEVSAYEGVRAAMDLSLDVQIQTTLEEYGFADMGIKTKKDLIAALAKEGAKELKSPSTIRQMQDAIKIIKDIEDKKRKGYIPFKRWGEIGIIVRSKGEDAELTHFERVEIPSLAVLGRKQVVGENKAVIEAVKRLREKYPSKDFTIHPFEMKDFSKLKTDINLTDLDVLKASSEMTEEEWDSLRGMLSEAMQKRGYKQHFLQSNDVSGYSADFERAINDYIVSVSGHLSRRVHMPKLDAAVSQIEKKGEASLFEYARKYVSYITDPIEEWSAMRQAVYFWYLAGNVASGVTNSTQPLMVTAPWFKAMFSHGQIAKQISKAYKDTTMLITAKNGTDIFDFNKAPDDVRDALIRAEAEGDFLPKNTHDAMAIADSNSSYMRGAGRRWRQVMDITSLTFSVPERANRVVTYISAYRFAIIPENKTKIMAFISRDQIGRAMLAGKNGSEFAEAFAHYAVISTQLRMGKLNRPTLSRGPGTLPFQFMSFSLQMLEMMYRLAKVHGGKSASSIGIMLFAVVAMAGIKGIPFEDDLQKLFESAYKTMTRTDIDIDSAMLKLLTKYVGKTAAQAIVKGMPYALANLDMSTRLGYGNLVPDDQSDLFGPWFNMFWTRPVQSMTELSRGEVAQAVTTLMPNMIKNISQAYLWLEDGIKSASTGDTIIPPEDVTKTDIGLKMLGFTSSSIAGERSRIYAEKRASTAANELRSDYYDRLARAYAGRIRASRNKDKEAELRYGDEIDAINIEKNTHNEDAPLHKQIIINDRTLKQRVVEEINGAKSNKPRKQARQEAEELKKVWGN